MNDQMDLNLVRPIFNATCDNTLEPMILCPFKCKWNVLRYNGRIDEMNAYHDMQMLRVSDLDELVKGRVNFGV